MSINESNRNGKNEIKKYSYFICLSVSVLFIAPASAEIRLPRLISDNMVLQRHIPFSVWGWADPCESITVELAGQNRSVSADAEGRWRVRFDPFLAGGPYEMTIRGTNTLTIKNILIGEVWVGSGQSNMKMSLQWCHNAETAIAAADFPMIRYFEVGQVVADTPQDNCKGQWKICSPKTAGDFSGMMYYFGKELYQQLEVPLGLISSGWGGTLAEAWVRQQILEADSDFSPIFDLWKEWQQDREKYQNQYDQAVKAWQDEKAKAEQAGETVPPKPGLPVQLYEFLQPSGCYNGMIAPLLPYGIRGIVWYQGESNIQRAWHYQRLFPALISSWRQDFQQGNFPFLFVQLPGTYTYSPDKEIIPPKGDPGDDAVAELREAQLSALSLPNTGMAVTIDVGDASNPHPGNKHDVGKRLALWALANTYRRSIPYSGPFFRLMKIEGDRIRVYFDHVDGGLTYKPTDVCDGEKLEGFAVAGEDRQFFWAEAHIDGDTVVVHSDRVASPIAVRYGWVNYPYCNLYNKAGLPASPFRSDDWPGITYNKIQFEY